MYTHTPDDTLVMGTPVSSQAANGHVSTVSLPPLKSITDRLQADRISAHRNARCKIGVSGRGGHEAKWHGD